jgi:hypothetical protein
MKHWDLEETEQLMFWICLRQMLSSNPDWGTDYSD